jgi:hypothetical protein
MADTSSGSGENIYTVLVFVSLLTLIAGVGYVWYRGFQVFGTAGWFIPGS